MWDNLKFFLIFCVVLGHIADLYADTSVSSGCLRLFIYTFHMPLFMFVSGLFEKKNIDEKRYDRIFSYLIMFVLIKALVFASKWIAEGERPGFSLISTGNVAWFAFCLFVFSFITMAVKNIKPWYIIVASIIIACVAGYDKNIGDKLCLSRIIVFFPFYYLGYILKPESVTKFLNKKILKIISVLVIVSSIAVIIYFNKELFDYKFVFTGRQSLAKLFKDYPFAFKYRLICYTVSIVIGCSFISLCPENFCKGIFAKLGSKTLQIYILHMPLRSLYMAFINDRFNLDSYFQGEMIIVYEILVSLLILGICILPFWKKLIDLIVKVPVKDKTASV